VPARTTAKAAWKKQRRRNEGRENAKEFIKKMETKIMLKVGKI
jgi:hypothetical protein